MLHREILPQNGRYDPKQTSRYPAFLIQFARKFVGFIWLEGYLGSQLRGSAPLRFLRAQANGAVLHYSLRRSCRSSEYLTFYRHIFE
jgi:hypothetical protein